MHRTRAKFYVRSVTAIAGQKGGSVELQPVSRGAANARWSSATPSGQITMTITNPAAWEQFRDALGDELYVTFESTPPEMLDPALHPFDRSDQPEGNYGHGMCIECGQPEDQHASTTR